MVFTIAKQGETSSTSAPTERCVPADWDQASFFLHRQQSMLRRRRGEPGGTPFEGKIGAPPRLEMLSQNVSHMLRSSQSVFLV